MENLRRTGICAYCQERSTRLYDAPLLRAPATIVCDLSDGDFVDWRTPGSAYPGTECFAVVTVDGWNYLRSDESPAEPICWKCFGGALSPNQASYVANQPQDFELRGWCQPLWVAVRKRSLSVA